MSRIGKAPVTLPPGVEVQLLSGEISIKGPLGTLKQALASAVKVEKVENALQFEASAGDARANTV